MLIDHFNFMTAYLSDTTPIVAKQYTEYCYPAPISDMRAAIDINKYYEFSTPALFWPLIWPEGRTLSGLRVLIAGCGTNQAAYNAMTMPQAKITAIDLSTTSLGHSQYLKEKHQLDNLTLHRLNLLDVASLGEQFDLIISTGVLHHMPDPDAGLRALRDVLAPDGMMSIMVYGRYLRLGVYMMQQAFRLLGCQQQTPEDVQLVKATLAALEPTHAVKRYLACADDLQYDAGLVDTFLHPQDRAYSVPDVLNFAQQNGLQFWDWIDRLDYSHTANTPAGHPILQRMQKLNQVEQWTVTELLTQSRGTHRFLLCHPEKSHSARRIVFEGSDWLHWIPTIRYPLEVLQKADPATKTPARIKRGWQEITLTQHGTVLLEQVDGKTPLSQIAQKAQQRLPDLTLEDVRLFFALMHEWGHVMYSLQPFQYPFS